VKSSLTVIATPKLAHANASEPLALSIQTRRSARNRRPPRNLATKAGEGPEGDITTNIRQLTDVLHCKLQQHFQRKDTEHVS
jgi:hypothetical protein